MVHVASNWTAVYRTGAHEIYYIVRVRAIRDETHSFPLLPKGLMPFHGGSRYCGYCCAHLRCNHTLLQSSEIRVAPGAPRPRVGIPQVIKPEFPQLILQELAYVPR